MLLFFRGSPVPTQPRPLGRISAGAVRRAVRSWVCAFNQWIIRHCRSILKVSNEASAGYCNTNKDDYEQVDFRCYVGIENDLLRAVIVWPTELVTSSPHAKFAGTMGKGKLEQGPGQAGAGKLSAFEHWVPPPSP